MTKKARPPLQSRFIQSIKTLRRQMGMNQTDLAKAMKSAGFPFHQPTIVRIEEGSRPVRLDEAYAIAEILGTSVEAMLNRDSSPKAPAGVLVPPGCVALDDTQVVDPAEVRVVSAAGANTHVYLSSGDQPYLEVAKPLHEVMRLLLCFP